MCQEVKTTEEIRSIVDKAIILILYYTDVVIPCPCGSGLALIDTDSCEECQSEVEGVSEPFADCYEDLYFSEVEGEIELVE